MKRFAFGTQCRTSGQRGLNSSTSIRNVGHLEWTHMIALNEVLRGSVFGLTNSLCKYSTLTFLCFFPYLLVPKMGFLPFYQCFSIMWQLAQTDGLIDFIYEPILPV